MRFYAFSDVGATCGRPILLRLCDYAIAFLSLAKNAFNKFFVAFAIIMCYNTRYSIIFSIYLHYKGAGFVKIIKRNGSEETFNSDKIFGAVTKANKACEKGRISQEEILDIADYVEYKCNKLNRAV
ncbi:MAG: ATP cone domain-containing protein, partial [Hominimerdicola sp.]